MADSRYSRTLETMVSDLNRKLMIACEIRSPIDRTRRSKLNRPSSFEATFNSSSRYKYISVSLTCRHTTTCYRLLNACTVWMTSIIQRNERLQLSVALCHVNSHIPLYAKITFLLWQWEDNDAQSHNDLVKYSDLVGGRRDYIGIQVWSAILQLRIVLGLYTTSTIN